MSQSNSSKQSVLFLCTENSARSQMAEVLLRNKAGEIFDVYSAGIAPKDIDPRTINCLQKFNLPITELSAKHIAEFTDKTFDYVITLCERANNKCRAYKGTLLQLAWDIADPKVMVGLEPFVATLYELDKRLDMFIDVHGNINNLQSHQYVPLCSSTISDQDNELSIDPSIFYKCLTDQIRLKTLMLTNYYGELCVCELMVALQEQSQPKVSRNLAVLKKAGIITYRKHGQWVFYQINPRLPQWSKTIISTTTESNLHLIINSLKRLATMHKRPNKVSFCS